MNYWLSIKSYIKSASTRGWSPAHRPGLTVGDHLIATISRAPHLEFVSHPSEGFVQARWNNLGKSPESGKNMVFFTMNSKGTHLILWNFYPRKWTKRASRLTSLFLKPTSILPIEQCPVHVLSSPNLLVGWFPDRTPLLSHHKSSKKDVSPIVDNVGIAMINHLFLMVDTTHLWSLGGWFIIAILTFL